MDDGLDAASSFFAKADIDAIVQDMKLMDPDFTPRYRIVGNGDEAELRLFLHDNPEWMLREFSRRIFNHINN